MEIKSKRRPNHSGNYKKSTYYLPDDLDIAIRTLAVEKRIGFSAVIAESVKVYLRENGKPVPAT
jgi:hypothetical protein